MKKTRKRYFSALVAMVLLLTTVVTSQGFAASSDIRGHWAESTINRWTSNGYISGYPDGTFRPNNAISRAEFVTLANKAFGYTTPTPISFTDVSTSYWAYSEIQKGVAAGYIAGDAAGTFRPGAAVTRQEAAVMLSQIKKIQGDTTAAAGYTDAYAIANWAKPYVGAVSNVKIMQGFPNGAFKPQTSMTRAEAVTALEKAMNTTVPTTPTNPTTPVYPSNPSTPSVSQDDYTLDETTLKNKTIYGDLIISSSLNSKTVTLTEVDVRGTVKVQGGGTINAKDCTFNRVELDKSSVTFSTDSKTKVSTLEFLEKGKITGSGYQNVYVREDGLSEATIDAEVNYVELDTDTTLKLYKNAEITTLEVTSNAKNGDVSFTSGSEVEDMNIRGKIRIGGRGDINTMTVYVSGIRSSIKPDKLVTKGDGEKPSYTTGSSGSSGGSGSEYDDLTLDEEDDRYDADGERYHNVRIEADGITFRDAIVYNRLTITRDVEDGEVVLDDITVRGDIYVYGGGDSSVIFRNCDIQGDIIAEKEISSSYGDEPVALRFEDDTEVDGDIIVRGETIIRADSDISLNEVSVERSLDEDLILDARIDTLRVLSDATVRIQSGNRISRVEIPTSSTEVDIRLEGSSYIGTLDNDSSYTSVSGSGTINTLTSNKDISISGGVTVNNNTSKFVAVTNITNIPTTMEAGDTVTLNPVVSPSNASYKTVQWTILSQDAGATLSGSQLKATQKGTVKLRATINNGLASGKAYTQDFTITVTEESSTFVAVTGITFTGEKEVTLSKFKEDGLQLKASVVPSNASNQKITWSLGSTNTANAVLSETGSVGNLVAGSNTKAGTVNVKATVENGLAEGVSKEETFTITIKEDAPDPTPPTEPKVTSVTASKKTGLKKDDEVTLTAAIGGELGDNSIEWSVSDGGKEYVKITPTTGNTTTATAKILQQDTAGEKQVIVTAKVEGNTADTGGQIVLTIAKGEGSEQPDPPDPALPKVQSVEVKPNTDLKAGQIVKVMASLDEALSDGQKVKFEVTAGGNAVAMPTETTVGTDGQKTASIDVALKAVDTATEVTISAKVEGNTDDTGKSEKFTVPAFVAVTDITATAVKSGGSDISLTGNDTAQELENGTYTLKGAVTGTPTYTEVTWSSASDLTGDQVTISDTSEITLTAKVENGIVENGELKAFTKSFKVKGKADTPESPKVTNITITGETTDGKTPDPNTAKNGEKFKVTATVDQNLQNGQKIKWGFKETVDDAVATIIVGNTTEAMVTIGNDAQKAGATTELTVTAQVVNGDNGVVSDVLDADQKITIAQADTSGGGGEQGGEGENPPESPQVPQQNKMLLPTVPEKSVVKSITLPTQTGEVGKAFDLSKAVITASGANDFEIQWILTEGEVQMLDATTIQKDTPGQVTMTAAVNGGNADGTVYTKDFVITFTAPELEKPEWIVTQNPVVTPEEPIVTPTPVQPEVQQPEVQQPEVQQPEVQQPEVQQPEVQQPEVQQPEVQQPEVQQPEVQQPEVQQPEVQQPEVQQPEVQQPEVQQPEVQQPEVQQPEVQQPEVQQPEVQPTEPIVTPTLVQPAEPTVIPDKVEPVAQKAENASMSIVASGSFVVNSPIRLTAKKIGGGVYSNVDWSIVSDGGTLATLQGNILHAMQAGIVTVQASVEENGTSSIRTRSFTIS